MDIPVLIEAIGDGRFRARSGEPLAVTAEAATREEAISKLRELVQACATNGKELISLPVATGAPSLPGGASIFKDDPFFDEWQEAIAEYRRQKDKEEGI